MFYYGCEFRYAFLLQLRARFDAWTDLGLETLLPDGSKLMH